MLFKRFLTVFRLVFLLTCLPLAGLMAASESYVQSLTGHLKKGDSLVVIDDKFLNLPLNEWNRLKHLSISDVVSFELRKDTLLNFYTKPFSCRLNVTIKYFTSRDQQDPTKIENVDLLVKYDTASGKTYPTIARYRFKDAFKIIVVINSISSPEWQDKLPDFFRLKSQILVERKYPFDHDSNPRLNLGAATTLSPMESLVAGGPDVPQPWAIDPLEITDGVLTVSWNPADFGGHDEFDLEWTFLDGQGIRGIYLDNHNPPSGPYNVDGEIIRRWMAHDATRVTVAGPPYKISVPYLDGYVLVRLRKVSYDPDTKVRKAEDWVFTDGSGNTTLAHVSPPASEKFNVQYTASFAEEGKRKEVITYFDGTQRNRQSVTLNNSDLFKDVNNNDVPVATVQETIYDLFGRPAANMLPAPTRSSSLNFYPSFNLDENNKPYNYSDIHLDDACSFSITKTSAASGASLYYSPGNTFLSYAATQTPKTPDYFYTRYVPDAKNYPFSAIAYTPDNTGRIRRQGGVGKELQAGTGNDTRFYYGKPTAKELERLFGM
ncbi:MAG TPA: hypothetical protein VI233_15910, partial [Puia sp.]